MYTSSWNKGKLIGQKRPLKLQEIWSIRIRIQMAENLRDLAMFNLAIDSKLRACDLVKIKVSDLMHGLAVQSRAIVIQQKTNELGREQLCLVLPASVETDVYDKNLLTELGLIDHPDAEHYLSLYLAQSQESYFTHLSIKEIPVTGYVNQISQILHPVAKGLGFTVLPKSAVDTFQEPQQLKIFSPKKPVMQTLYMVTKRSRVLPARFEVVKSILQKHLDAVKMC